MSRFPLWTTLIPLLAGILIWAFIWNGYRREFASTLEQLLPPGTAVETGGFPYRLEASVAPLTLARQTTALRLSLDAQEAVVNRVPWQPQRNVLNLRYSIATARLLPVSGATVTIKAPEAQASLRTEAGTIARLSVVWQQPRIATGLLALPVTADSFEAHLRETPGGPAGSNSPRLPTQDQMVLSGTRVRFGGGAPLTLALDSEVTAAGPVRSLATWEDGGTMEVRALTLADTTGEVARFKGTLAADGNGGLLAAGTVETVCPASLRAAFAGQPAPSEKRSRRPERIAFSGAIPGGLVLAARDATLPPPPVRGQEPACPRFR